MMMTHIIIRMYLAPIELAKFLSLLETATSGHKLVLILNNRKIISVSDNRVSDRYLDAFPESLMSLKEQWQLKLSDRPIEWYNS